MDSLPHHNGDMYEVTSEHVFRLSGGVEGEEMPLAGGGGGGRGPAQCSPARRLDASSCDVSSLSSGEEDERLRRYRTASAVQPPSTPAAPALASYALHTHQVKIMST